jgi:hypothetical protein
MNRDPQRGRARRARGLVLAACVLAAGGWGVAPAWADIYVHVVNCTEYGVNVEAYDAKDSVEVVAASTASLPSGDPGKSEQLHCAGEGKGFCKVAITLSVPSSECEEKPAAGFHLDSGTWAVVKGYTETDGDCALTYEEDLDSAPSCD